MINKLNSNELFKASLLSFIRFPLMLLLLLITYLFCLLFNFTFSLAILTNLSAIYFIIVNILSYILLRYILKKENRSLKHIIGFSRKTIFKDILWGYLWCIVLFIPFIIGIMITMFILYQGELFLHFESVFAPSSLQVEFPNWFMLVTAILSAIVFPLLNAPVEELIYRGYAQTMYLKKIKKTWLSLLIPAIGFSLQHILFSNTINGMLVYMVAFLLWGIGAGLIYYKQKRLMPLIIAHLITNISFGIIPLIFVLTA